MVMWITFCNQTALSKHRPDRENPLLFFGVFLIPIGIHPEGGTFLKCPGQVKILAFQYLGQVADHQFPEGMIPMETAGQQVVNPVQILGVIDMPIHIQIRKNRLFGYRAGPAGQWSGLPAVPARYPESSH